jgi:phosphoglycolate phosphatase
MHGNAKTGNANGPDAGLAIFDLDGTLADTRADIAAAVNATRRALGLKAIPLQRVVDAVGDGMAKLLERTIPERSDVPAAEKRAIWTREYSARWLDETIAYPGIPTLLRRLKRLSWRMVVLTNKPDDAAKAVVGGLGLAKYFSLIRGFVPDLPMKPSPEAVRLIVRDSGYNGPRSRVWMVGDNHTDICAARLAGVASCFCAFGFGHLMGEIPTVTVEKPAEILGNLTL